MFRRYARTMGNFVGGIENPYAEYDICPGCGGLKTVDHDLCVPCAARARAAAERETVALEARRSEAHEFYREKMAEGWSPLATRTGTARRQGRPGTSPFLDGAEYRKAEIAARFTIRRIE